jgi:hypothetical protein
MEMTLEPPAATCRATGRAFIPGDRVASYLVRAEGLGIRRFDLLAAEAEGFEAPGPVACRWVHVFKPRPKADDPERALKLTAESLFLELADPANEPTPENTRLLQFLALMLERKRLLRFRGATPDGARLRYEHGRSKQTFEVAAGELGPEFFRAVQEQLSVLVGEPRPEAPPAPEPAPAA